MQEAGGALAIEEGAAGALHAGEDVIDRLGPHADELAADDPRDEIRRHIEDRLDGGRVQPLAEDAGHRLGENLHLRPERDAEVDLRASGSDLQEDADGIGAFLVLADILEVVGLVLGTGAQRAAWSA